MLTRSQLNDLPFRPFRLTENRETRLPEQNYRASVWITGVSIDDVQTC